MDTSTCFHLNSALAGWRTVLLAHEALTPDRVRELETHLREETARLAAAGLLSEEEAFLVARRRLGEPGALSAEFHRAQPAAVWRGRVFWMAIGILAFTLFKPLAEGVSGLLVWGLARWDAPAAQGLMALAGPLLFITGMLALLLGLAHGRWPRFSGVLDRFCSRQHGVAWQLVLATAVPTLLVFAAGFLFMASMWDFWPGARPFMVHRLVFVLWPLALALLAAHLAPSRWTDLPAGRPAGV